MAGVHIGLIGMLASFQRLDVIADVITLGIHDPDRHRPPGRLARGRHRCAAPTFDPRAAAPSASGPWPGAVTGVLLALFAIFITTVDIQWVLQNANQATADVLQYEQGPGLGSAILIGVSIAMGAAGASLNVIPGRIARGPWSSAASPP